MQIGVGSKVWLKVGGEGVLGRGRCALLKAIEDTGSIKKAAERVGVAEKTAHRYLRRMEESFGQPLVRSARGGSEGGTTFLTPFAQRLIDLFEDAQRDLAEHRQPAVVQDVLPGGIL